MSGGGSGRAGRWWLALEFACLFVLMPIGLSMLRAAGMQVRPIPVLWLLALGCLIPLLRDRSFDRRRFWMWSLPHAEPPGRNLPRVFTVWAVAALGLILATWWLRPDLLWGFPRQRPELWALVMVLYPILSVYPQGVVYRAFVMHRYRPLLGDGWAATLLSAVAFSLAHLILLNPVAPLLTLPVGVLFAHTYRRTRSLPMAALEHALYGCTVFTVGIGWYFYGGARG